MFALFGFLTTFAQDGELTWKFDFSSLSDESGTYTGTLHNGATLSTFGGQPVLKLGDDGGYFDLGSKFGEVICQLDTNFTISANVYIPADFDKSSAGNVIWSFANSATTGYMQLDLNTPSFSFSGSDKDHELSLVFNRIELVGDQWYNIIIMKRAGVVRFFATNDPSKNNVNSLNKVISPASLGHTTANYIGRSVHNSDVATKGVLINNFLIINKDVTNTGLSNLRKTLNPLNTALDSIRTRELMHTFTMPDMSALEEDITLPSYFKDTIYVKWESSDYGVITPSGVISRPAHGMPIATAILTAYLSQPNGNAKDTLQFNVGVMPEFSDEEILQLDHDALSPTGLSCIFSSVSLPTVAPHGSVIVWESSEPEWLTNYGKVLKQPEGESKTVTLTATLVHGKQKMQKEFTAVIRAKENYSKYLFVYFPSNADENLYYAISSDGYTYTPINNGQMFLRSDSVSRTHGLRDPHILRGHDGWFYMVATDMVCANGWDSNRGLVLMKSRDLIHWSHSAVHFPTRFAGNPLVNGLTRVWAPETIYDKQAGKYMVYFSLRTGSNQPLPYDKVFYCYANEDFTDLETEPVYLYDRGSATIDMDIVYNDADGLYHGFYKTEGEGGICKVTAETLTAQGGAEPGSQWSAPSGTLQQTTEDVEGAGVFRLINSNSWVLMYDCYRNGHYQFCSSPDLTNFTFVQNTVTQGSFTPRHGTVIPITPSEEKAILEALPVVTGNPSRITGFRNPDIDTYNAVIESNTVYLPVSRDADIEAFDPQFIGSPTATITPVGPQNFKDKTVTYTVTNEGRTQTYEVTVERCGNPVIPAFHADPEVLFSKQTGRFYIYPTTDGYTGWGGYSFDVFSSPDLLHFTNEGTILNLQRGKDVAWSAGNAWAPCIEEKFMDGKWKYFFYFSGQNPSLNVKTLGVAVADSPTGPFKASATPLFTSSAAGQMIDSDVFTDPVSGQSYLYYGNGQLCYRLLASDMMHTDGSEYVITPAGGTNADYRFREGAYVFYRNGIYYFLWSVDDTGSTNYHVAYGTSTSPTGPITVATDPIVIIQNSRNSIYGTGHNSIINVPGTDDWYIVYHRINKKYLSDGPGYHREVCIDKMEFAPDGTIYTVGPTHRGIDPVNMGDIVEMITGIEEPAQTTSKVIRVGYYTIDGKSLGTTAPNSRGIYIRREVLSNGQVRSLKIVR